LSPDYDAVRPRLKQPIIVGVPSHESVDSDGILSKVRVGLSKPVHPLIDAAASLFD